MQTRKTHETRRAAPTVDAGSGATHTRGASGVHGPAPVTLPGEMGGFMARVGFAPIVRVDEPRRELELCATSEAVDSYGTVFDYEASKDAFTRWLGNVREMHERRAVGRRVAVRCDDSSRRIFVTVRISRGARDTWEKVLDGTLRGASIGASNVTWERQSRVQGGHERELHVATHYDLVELSLVDNPSNPDALGVTIVRDAVPDLALLDLLQPDDAHTGPATSARAAHQPIVLDAAFVSVEDARANGYDGCIPLVVPALTLPQKPPSATPEPETALPAAANASTVAAAGESPQENDAPIELWIARRAAADGWAALQAAPPAPRGSEPASLEERHEAEQPAPRATETPRASRARGPFSANDAGYPDAGVPERAEERPTAALGAVPEGNARQRLHTAARAVLQSCGCACCDAAMALLLEGGAGAGEAGETLTRSAASSSEAQQAALARVLSAGLSASTVQLDQMNESVRGLREVLRAGISQMAGTVGDLRLRLEAVEAQPMPGGPVANARAVEKTHALTPYAARPAGEPSAADRYRALESLAGRLTDPQAQVAVAAELIRLQRESAG